MVKTFTQERIVEVGTTKEGKHDMQIPEQVIQRMARFLLSKMQEEKGVDKV